MTMPGSILLNDGRRSASPDRRVTFGNIERYDIMTSNEIKNNMNQKRGKPKIVVSPNGNYPMTRLDNRIRKSIKLGFTDMIGDHVTYNDIVEFLLEFGVIANAKVCNERQVTAIVQSAFPKVIVKSSAAHSMVYLNLENRSDEIVKEELVRVTTEPIYSEWIEEEEDDDVISDEDINEELDFIESQRHVTKDAPSNIVSVTPTDMTKLIRPSAESLTNVRERAIDVPHDHIIQKSYIEVGRNKSGSKTHTAFTEMNKADQATDTPGSRTKNDSLKTSANETPGRSSLQRNRSFTRSTDRSFVGTIRDRFRSGKSKSHESKAENTKEKVLKNTEETTVVAKTTNRNANVKNNNSEIQIPLSLRKTDQTKSVETQPNTAKISNARTTYPFGGSVVDVRSSFRTNSGITKNSNGGSVSDVRSSFNNTSKPLETKHSFRSAGDLTSNENKNYVRRTPSSAKTTQNGDTRMSYRKNEKPNAHNEDMPTRRGGSNNIKHTTITTTTSNSRYKIAQNVKRTDSLKGARPTLSSRSSSSSTPNISRENSKTNIKTVKKRTPTKDELDLAKIAMAFQKAKKGVTKPQDNIEHFMITVATEDLEECANERLKLDDLYDHIRHRMILSKDEIFDGDRSKVTVDMSEYFELLFRSVAANFDRIGCEMVTDMISKKKVNYLIHVKLVDYVDDLSQTADHVTERSNSCYV